MNKGGTGKAVADMGRVVFTSSDITNGVATFTHKLGDMPDYILLFALDNPPVSSDDVFYFMGFAGGSKALSDRIIEKNPDIESAGFICAKSYTAGDADNNYYFIANTLKEFNYEESIASYPGRFGGLCAVSETEISFGSSTEVTMAMKAGREFFFAVIGNLF